YFFSFFNLPASTSIYTLSLHDALPILLDTIFNNIYNIIIGKFFSVAQVGFYTRAMSVRQLPVQNISAALNKVTYPLFSSIQNDEDRKSTRLNSSHVKISYAVFCLKKKT